MSARPQEGRLIPRPAKGTWSIRYELPRDPNGKRRWKVVGGYRSPLAARRALDAALAEVEAARQHRPGAHAASAMASASGPATAPPPAPASADATAARPALTLVQGWLAEQVAKCAPVTPEQARAIANILSDTA